MLIASRMYVALVLALSVENRKDKEKGAAMVEYGLLIAFIAVIALVAVKVLGTKVSTLFDNISF
jgi:pilus assembly protein Flp/PilA